MNVGTLTIEMAANIARLQKDMDAARKTVESTMAQIQRAVNAAKATILTLAGIGSVAMFTGLIKGSINGAAALHDLAIQTGASVEALSALGSVGKLSDVSAQQIAGSMNKLAKNMAGATEESKGTGKALDALGINFNTFSRMKPEDQMKTVALAMNGFQDGSGKAAVAMALFGKEGAALLPFLKDLAEVGELNAKFTKEQAAMADNFDDNLKRLKTSGSAWTKEIAMGMLPALNNAAQAYLDVMNGVGGLRDQTKALSKDGSITTWTSMAITGLTYVMDAGEGVWRVLKTLGMSWGALIAAASAVKSGEFTQAKNIMLEFGHDVSQTWSAETLGQKLRDRIAELEKLGVKAEAQKPKLSFVNILDKNKEAADKFESSLTKLLDKINGKAAGVDADFFNNMKLLREAYDKGRLSFEEYNAAATKYVQQQKFYTDAQEKAAEAAEQQIKAMEEMLDARAKVKDALRESIQELDFETSTLRMSNYEREVAIKLHAAEKLGLEKGTAAYEEYAAAIRKSVADNQYLKDRIAAEEKIRDEVKKTSEMINEKIVDSLMKGFEKGKSIAQDFRDTLVNMFKTLVLRPIVNFVVNPIGAAVSGATSGMIANAAGSMSLGSLADTLGLSSAYNGIMGAFGQTGLGLTGSTAGTVGGASLASLGLGGAESAAMGGSAGWVSGMDLLAEGSALGSGTAAGGLSSMLGAIPAVGWAALAAVVVSQLMSGGETRYGGGYVIQPDGKAKYTGGPDGGAIGNGAVEKMIEGAFGSLNGILKAVGSNANITGFQGGLETSENDKGGTFAGGFINGQAFGKIYNDGQHYNQSIDAQGAVAQLAGDLSRATLEALKSATDIPKTISDALAGTDVKALTTEQANAIIGDIQAVVTAVDQFRNSVSSLPFLDLKNLSFDAAANLIKFSGGIQQLNANLGTFLQNYYTEAERMDALRTSVMGQLAALNVTGVTTKAQFRALVESIDKTTEPGQKLYTSLLAISGAFAQVADAADNATTAVAAVDPEQLRSSAISAADTIFAALQRAVEAERKSITESYQTQLKSIQESIDNVTKHADKLRSVSQSARSALDGMLANGPNASALQQNAAAQLKTMLALFRSTGLVPDQDKLARTLANATKIDPSAYGSFVDYARAFYDTAIDISDLQDVADKQLSADERQLEILTQQKDALTLWYQAQMQRLDNIVSNAQQQLDVIKGIDTTVKTIPELLQMLAAAIQAAVAVGAGQTGSSAGGAAGMAISGAYQDALHRAPEAAGYNYWTGQVANGSLTTTQAIDLIKNSNEAKVQQLYGGILGRVGEAEGVAYWTNRLNSGASLDQIRSEFIGSAEYVNRMKAMGVPGYASGGVHGGGWRMVGELGPELAYTGPQTIVSNANARDMLDMTGVKDEMKGLRDEFKQTQMKLVSYQSSMAKVFDDWNARGLPGTREE